MTLSWAQVLMLPLDVSNLRGFGGQIDMKLFWFIVYITTAVFVLIIIPTFIFFYEADEEWSFYEKLKYTLCYLIATIIVIIVILVVLYAFIGTVKYEK
jgi:hypothetical protein